jgi:signal peptidase I
VNRLIVFTIIMIFFTACSQEPLRDDHTTEAIANVNVGEGMVLYKHMNDNMERRQREFSGSDVVVDPSYYKSNTIQRGDIVYYQQPQAAKSNNGSPDTEISRIVALPGESIRIEKGLIFINGRKLETFYGQARWGGMNVDELNKVIKSDSNSESIKNVIKIIQESDETNKKEIKVPDGQYYIIGDDWIRSGDSRHYGPILKNSILGKVIGYKNL